jgi:dTDP-4-amino-4,6-dideoxygalactose transaminase
MRNGADVAAFEAALAGYTGARYAIAASNGTVTLQAALAALGAGPGWRVAVPPLTMAATTLAVLNVGAEPVFWDVDPRTWLMAPVPEDITAFLPVSLYGLHSPWTGEYTVDDAAQTLRGHSGCAFTSLSFQASKVLALGEGGALLTDDEALASKARSYLSLGYQMGATQSRIDPAALKSPTFARHHRYPAINGRMNDLTAREGLRLLKHADLLLSERADCAAMYAHAIAGCPWLTPQHVPEGCRHDYWTYAVACRTPALALSLARAVVAFGGEAPYPAWRLTYQEPALRHSVLLAPDGTCPVAESLQPRLLQFQTNDLASAERNARALRAAIAVAG